MKLGFQRIEVNDFFLEQLINETIVDLIKMDDVAAHDVAGQLAD